MTKELLIGCGNSREKKLYAPADNKQWHGLVTVDFDPNCRPDVVHDLNMMPYPFGDAEFDEIHAYEVLEHLGQQGNWRFFFSQFAELWRIIKPGGMLFGTAPTPSSPWAWGDPSHTRIISLESLSFLSQANYVHQVGKTAMTDFRHFYKADWETIWEQKDNSGGQLFALKAIKP